MTWQDNDTVCYCQEILYKTILDAIQNGAKTVEDIIDATDAGIACGTCIADLEEIIEDYNRAIERKR